MSDIHKRLTREFYTQEALVVAPSLLGKILARRLDSGQVLRYRITETECYCGEEDTACHARVGKTKRTATLYEQGGICYIYLCYGIHYLLNVVTGKKDMPQAVLIRGVERYNGPGKLTKAMQITKDLNNIDFVTSSELWIEDDGYVSNYKTAKRIGIDYATQVYKDIEWRFILI